MRNTTSDATERAGNCRGLSGQALFYLAFPASLVKVNAPLQLSSEINHFVDFYSRLAGEVSQVVNGVKLCGLCGASGGLI